MPPKKHIITIGVLCVIALGLGYVYGKWRQGSGQENAGNPEGKEGTAIKEPEFLKQGLVAYYPFNGNAKDESGNGKDGYLNGVTLSSDRFGESGKAYGFDGENDFIEIGTGGVGANPHQLTQIAWIQTKDRRAGWPVVILTKRQRIGSDCPTFGIIGGYATLAIDGDSFIENVIGNSHVSDGEWHQIVGVRDNLKYSVYVDGKIEKSKEVSHVLEGSDLPMHIGHHGGWGTYFQGSLDDIRIYNRALSEAEVKELYEFEKVN